MKAKEFKKDGAPFLNAIRQRRLTFFPEQQTDPAFDTYYESLPNRFTFMDLLAHQSSSGDTILHLIALSSELGGVLEVINVESTEEEVEAAVMKKNNGEETPLHLACRYLNMPLFEFIVKNTSVEMLQEIASVIVNDGGFNAVMVLFVAAFNNAALPLYNFLQNESPPDSWSRQAFESVPINPVFLTFIARFKQILGAGLDDLLLTPDWSGNTAFLWACFTQNEQCIQECISAFTDPLKLRQAVVATLPEKEITPFKLLCAFGSAKTLHMLFSNLRGQDNFLCQLCMSQDALGWCYKTRLESKNDFENTKRLDVIASAYKDRLECAVIANDDRPSLLTSDNEGILVRKILTKIPSVVFGRRHYHVQYQLVYELFRAIKADFLSDARKLLLDDLFKICWSRAIIMGMSDALIKQMGEMAPTESNLKEAILTIIMTHKKSSVYIPLALFYKVDKLLNEREYEFVARFQKGDLMINSVQTFCETTKVNCLERILVSRSLLKTALFQKLELPDYDNEVNEADDKQAVKARYMAMLEQGLFPKPIEELDL